MQDRATTLEQFFIVRRYLEAASHLNLEIFKQIRNRIIIAEHGLCQN